MAPHIRQFCLIILLSVSIPLNAQVIDKSNGDFEHIHFEFGKHRDAFSGDLRLYDVVIEKRLVMFRYTGGLLEVQRFFNLQFDDVILTFDDDTKELLGIDLIKVYLVLIPAASPGQWMIL